MFCISFSFLNGLAKPSSTMLNRSDRSGSPFPSPMRERKSESEVAQSCPTLSNPMDCSPPGSSVHGIFQARVLEWGAIMGRLLLSRSKSTLDQGNHVGVGREVGISTGEARAPRVEKRTENKMADGRVRVPRSQTTVEAGRESFYSV